MFPRIVKTKKKSGEEYEYLVISESVRDEKGRSTTRNIAKLGNVKKLDRKSVKSLLDGLIRIFEMEEYALSDGVEIIRSYDHGDILVWRTLWNRLRLSKIIEARVHRRNRRIKLDVVKYVEMMVVNRCVAPRSKLATSRWFDDTAYSVLEGFKGLDMNVEYFYRSMDYLLKVKDDVERDVFKRLRDLFSVNVKLTFYDITSTYFHSDGCGIAAYGYSRDHRPDKRQIIIGIVTSYEGYPVKHYVFSGNTKDEKTVSEVVRNLKDEFNIEETAFVGDRGMLTKLNIESLASEGFDYIMGVKIRQSEIVETLFEKGAVKDEDSRDLDGLKIWDRSLSIKDFMLWKAEKIYNSESNSYDEKERRWTMLSKSLEAMDENSTYDELRESLKVILDAGRCPIRMALNRLMKRYEGRYGESERFVIACNPARAEASQKEREEKLNAFSGELDDLARKLKSGRLKKSVDKALDDIFDGHKRKFRKLFALERGDGSTFNGYQIDREALDRVARYDGFFVLASNLKQDQLSPEKAVKEYKRLQEVETLFDDLKHFVDVNPVRHWLEERVRCHVFLCVLALLLKRVFEIDCLKSKAVTEALESVAKVKLVLYKVRFSEKSDRHKTLPKVSNVSEKQRKVFEAAGVSNPMAIDKFAW